MDCEMSIATWTTSLWLVPIYNSKGNIIDMCQVSVTPIIPREKAACQAICKNIGASVLKEPDDTSSESRNDYESESEGQQSEGYVPS